jgi:hypothetical protein
VGAQVDLRRAARALDDHRLEARLQPRECLEHLGQQRALSRLVRAGLELGARLPEHHELSARVACRLEQDRIHVGKRSGPRRNRLERLRAADLAAVGGKRAVERHVLRLERRDAPSAPRERAADPGDERALARAGGRSLDHEGAARSVESFHARHFRAARPLRGDGGGRLRERDR